MKKMLALLLIAAVIPCWAVPQMINYQGYLTRPDGTPLDTTVSMAFAIYTQSSGGLTSWSETQPSVTVTDGLFHVLLGSVTPIPEVFAGPRWLGITVGNNTQMTPRQQIVSVAHAYRVGTVDGSEGGLITGDVIVEGRGNIGLDNTNTGGNTFVAGQDNSASGTNATVGGGRYNHASGNYSVIGGGGGATPADSNAAIGNYSVVSGGRDNTASAINATVGGGGYNVANNNFSTVGGGALNTVAGVGATISGGSTNNAGGYCGTVPGGLHNRADGDYSFAAGRFAQTSGDGVFAWADASGDTFGIGLANSFNARASGGFRFWTSAHITDNIGARLPANSSAWTALSDSTRKTDIRRVDTNAILEKVIQVPVSEWRYKAQPDPSIRHIGPMAQDFWKAFHLGEDSLSISTIDPSGIALAAIQELAKRCDQLEQQNLNLQNQIQSLLARDEQTRIIKEK